jgi:hypothetical protein
MDVRFREKFQDVLATVIWLQRTPETGAQGDPERRLLKNISLPLLAHNRPFEHGRERDAPAGFL